MVLLLSFYILAPAAVILLCRKIKFFGKIGPILILYVIGVIAGNLPIMPEGALKLQTGLSSGIIPIAIPMMLFTLNFRKFSIKRSVLTLVCGAISVIAMVILAYVLLKGHLGPDSWKIGGMIGGLEIGGMPNLASLQMIFGVPVETYILITTYDMIVCFIYFVFLMSFGIRLARRILPNTGITATGIAAQQAESIDGEMNETDAYMGIFRWRNLRQILAGLALAVVVLGISFTVAAIAGGGLLRGFDEIMNGSSFMVILILTLTTLGIGASFIPGVRRLEKSYDGGMYLVYIFSVVIASMADLSRIDLSEGLYLLLFMAIVVYGSLILQVLLSRLLKIDADSMVISSVALINSPPFVPMIAAAMRNRDAIIPGIAIGIAGYAVGNYIGVLMAEFMKLL